MCQIGGRWREARGAGFISSRIISHAAQTIPLLGCTDSLLKLKVNVSFGSRPKSKL